MANLGNGVWIVEDKGSWLTDPENLDITDFTDEGNDYIKLDTVLGVKPSAAFSFSDIIDIYQGVSLDTTISVGHFQVEIEFIHGDSNFDNLVTKLSDLLDFVLNHSSGSQADTYLVIRYNTDKYFLFPNGSGTPGNRKKYMKGRLVMPVPQIVNKQKYLTGKLIFRSVLD